MENKKAAAKIHRDALVIDAHSDIPLDVVKRRRRGETQVLRKIHVPDWRAGGVNATILTVAGDESSKDSPKDYTIEAIKLLKEDVQECSEDVAIARTADELIQETNEGRVAVMLNIEGSKPLEGSLHNLERYYQSGVRFMTLTWNAGNEVGTGVGCSPDQGGLTNFGRNVVQTMNRLGMLIDLSHASPATFWDVAKMDPGNIIASHSNSASLYPHVRNLTDDQIRTIASQDGFVGICFYPGFLHEKTATVEDIVDHIAYVGDLVGLEYAAIGADYIYFALEDIIDHLQSSNIDYGNDFVYPTGVETTRTLSNLTAAMTRRGFRKDEIQKVLGVNVLRVFKRLSR